MDGDRQFFSERLQLEASMHLYLAMTHRGSVQWDQLLGHAPMNEALAELSSIF
jgi:hypothetical protein